MPHTNKPNTTTIQDMFNDILSIKEKSSKFPSSFSTEKSCTGNNISNDETQAVNGNVVPDQTNLSVNGENVSLPSADLQLNGHEVDPKYKNLTSSHVSLSKDTISETCSETKLGAEPNLPVTHTTQPIVYSNSCSDASSETEDYFDQESISTASLSCSPFLPKKIISLTSDIAPCPKPHTLISSADDGAIASEASDVENFEAGPICINKNDPWYTPNTNSRINIDERSLNSSHDITALAEEAAASVFLNPTTATTISSWLSRVQSHGFPADVLRNYIIDEINYECDETWWDPSVVRIFDPYYDIAPEDIEEITEGKTNAAGDPVGQCTLLLTNGDEVYGNFRKGVRQVMYCIYM